MSGWSSESEYEAVEILKPSKSSSVTQAPPIRSVRSKTTTFRPARASSSRSSTSWAEPYSLGSIEIFCQILRDRPTVSDSIVLTVSKTTVSRDSSAHRAAVLPTRLSISEQ